MDYGYDEMALQKYLVDRVCDALVRLCFSPLRLIVRHSRATPALKPSALYDFKKKPVAGCLFKLC